ncbi:acyl-CoA dehydratase activase [Vallitalea guaymasensis]|uniref:acyl-CoA dehydratase activase n=1 Tax=Vallitalea guaymasensis TaxID=1185412 RepID=UPI000DE41DAF|nr:acyl-CoA dehydratase activase [Vallitalea guaymasensis]
MYSIGIDIGYSAIKIILMDSNCKIKYSKYLLHKGKVKQILIKTLEDLLIQYNNDDIKLGAVTGNGSKFLSKGNKAQFVNEVASIVEGSTKIDGNIKSIIEIGGESAKYITGFEGKDKSKIQIAMNSNCSAGTGSFLEEQMSRLNLKLEDYSLYANRAKSIPRIAGRCSVFAKTDITHHQQEGVSVDDILLGLAYAVIKNYRGAIIKKLPLTKPILFSGGVANNQGIITALKDVLNLEDGDLIIPEHFSNIGAYGAAIIAKNDELNINLIDLLNYVKSNEDYRNEDNEVKLPKLIEYGNGDSFNKHIYKSIEDETKRLDCYLGIDIGSTSTNLVLMDENKEIISYKYLKTLGNPIEAVRLGLKVLMKEFGDKVNVIGVGTTGSGRYMIGKFIGADVVKDEITAQAKAAVTIDKSVDTIFEIGGQDSKYISIKEGVVTDFQMNKICAAGTGSFIEEQAKKFNIPINEFGDMALDGDTPINLGERCTVFIETSIASNISKGAKMENIASGLCYSIVKNYIGRVVGQKKIGNKIFLQGGVAFNQGIVNAFRTLTGKDIVVPPFFSVTGAYGAAILAKEGMTNKKTKFKGFNIENKEFLERHREDKLKQDNTSIFNNKVTEIVFDGYKNNVDGNKKTVGIPRALFTFGMFSMFHGIFKDLGFNVVLSEPTNEETIRLGQQYALDETCYPVKLITGHVAELVGKNVDYIFFPDLFSVDHPGSKSRVNYGCAFMQLAFKVMNQTMELDKKGIQLLSPTFAFNLGKKFMMESFSKMGKQLNRSKEQIQKALGKGTEAYYRFEEKMEENGKEVLGSIKPEEKVFVMISKIYGVADPMLNMGIPSKLMDMGYKVIPFYDLPEGDVSKEYPNMFWPFGQHILEPAKLVKEHPNLYAILLTHHGCGPDSIISHYFREEMDGKPYLHIEVDEHSSGVGVITRVEAFINSLNSIGVKKANPVEVYQKKIVHKETNVKYSLKDIDEDTIVYLPYLYPYSDIFKELLINYKIDARTLPETSQSSIYMGRKFTITEEYFSLTALLGDVFTELASLKEKNKKIAFLIPRNEGTETDGQYGRLLRTKLDEEGYKDVDVISPFMEDVLNNQEDYVTSICLGLLAGDIVRAATKDYRDKCLKDILKVIKSNNLTVDELIEIANEVREDSKSIKHNKKILAVGEVWILYNHILNNDVFDKLEDKGHKIVYSPLSETMWLFWKDFLNHNMNETSVVQEQRLARFKENIRLISRALSSQSPFEYEIDNLVETADRTIGYYSGANGRYREAKVLGQLNGIDGNITVASMYENTGIVLGILHKGFEQGNEKPILNLTFDGNKNENQETKIESFMYYL